MRLERAARDGGRDPRPTGAGAGCALNVLLGMAGAIGGASKNSHCFEDHAPVRRNTNFAAAEYRDNFDLGSVALDVRFSKVDLEAAEDGDDFTTQKILSDDAPASTPKDVQVVQPRRRRIGPVVVMPRAAPGTGGFPPVLAGR